MQICLILYYDHFERYSAVDEFGLRQNFIDLYFCSFGSGVQMTNFCDGGVESYKFHISELNYNLYKSATALARFKHRLDTILLTVNRLRDYDNCVLPYELLVIHDDFDLRLYFDNIKYQLQKINQGV